MVLFGSFIFTLKEELVGLAIETYLLVYCCIYLLSGICNATDAVTFKHVTLFICK